MLKNTLQISTMLTTTVPKVPKGLKKLFSLFQLRNIKELEVLKLPPKFCLYDKLDPKKFENQLERMNAKLRYSARRESETRDDSDPPERLDASGPAVKPGDKLDAPGPAQTNPGDQIPDLTLEEALAAKAFHPDKHALGMHDDCRTCVVAASSQPIVSLEEIFLIKAFVSHLMQLWSSMFAAVTAQS